MNLINIPNYDECVKCALDMKGIQGENFKDADLRVYVRRTANPGTVFTALRKGGIRATAFPADGKTYHPKLLDLKLVELLDGFEEMREAIAENAHDTWVHVPNCVDDTPWAEADESENNPRRKKQ